MSPKPPESAGPLRLDARAADFETAFAAFLAKDRDSGADVDGVVRDIIADVRRRGDDAVFEYTARFDRLTLTPQTLRFTPRAIAQAVAGVSAERREAIGFAARRLEAYHRKLLPRDVDFTDEAGVRLGARFTPIDAVGLYVPGGKAAYPSSVLMNAVPAKVAGVPRVAMVVPTPDGVVDPLVLCAADAAGSTRSTASVAPRRWRRWPGARRASRRSTRSSAPATPMSPPPSARSSARSASI